MAIETILGASLGTQRRELGIGGELKELILDLQRIVADLKKERDRLIGAIAALVGSVSQRTPKKRGAGAPPRAGVKRKKRGGITPEGRKRLSLAMKKRWAGRRKKGL
jgi:hypothetical protein